MKGLIEIFLKIFCSFFNSRNIFSSKIWQMRKLVTLLNVKGKKIKKQTLMKFLKYTQTLSWNFIAYESHRLFSSPKILTSKWARYTSPSFVYSLFWSFWISKYIFFPDQRQYINLSPIKTYYLLIILIIRNNFINEKIYLEY